VSIVGKELRSLHLPWNLRDVRVPAEIWGLCPKLEDLDGSFELLPAAPPAGHPIHTLGVSTSIFNGRKLLEEILSDWPSLRTLRISASWKYRSGPYKLSWNFLIEWVTLRSLSMQDRAGESWTEYFARVKLLKNTS
jgi:hypothetical protein